MNRLLTFAQATVRLRWLWDLGYGTALVLGISLAISTSRWVGLLTIAAGVWLMAADAALWSVKHGRKEDPE